MAKPQPFAALESLARQLQVLNRLEVLDDETFQHLTLALDRERQQLLGAASAVEVAEPRQQEEAAVKAEVVEASPTQLAERDDREFVSEAPINQRAAQFKSGRESFSPSATETPAREPKRSWTDWLAAFMEERNMRWGELVGGLLIVCCSIALVISFWSEIAERPWLKFFVFNGVTAGLFGVGFYSEHRWRLQTTSQGLLIIATLLVPLNFLAIAALSNTPASEGPLTLLGELISALLFGGMAYYAGKILLERDAPWLVGGVLLASVSQLLVRRYADPATTTAMLLGLAALPVACCLIVNSWTLRRAAREPNLSEREANALLKFAGLTLFAAVLPLALLLFKSGRPLETLRQLSIMVNLLGLVPLAVGLLLWRRLDGAGLTGLRTAGTSVAVFGAVVSLAGVVVGWPDPAAMLPATLVDFAIFSWAAWRFRLPAAHLVAAACLAPAYVLGIYLAEQRLSFRGNNALEVARTLVSGDTGWLLPPIVLAYAAVAYLVRKRESGHGQFLAIASVTLAVASLGLVSWFGLGVEGDPVGAAWVYLVYAAGCLALSARSRRQAIAWTGAVLLLAGVVQGVVFRYGPTWQIGLPEVMALLVFCTLGAAAAIVVRLAHATSGDSPLLDVLWNAAFISSFVAAGWLVFAMLSATAPQEASYWLWLALVWFVIAAATAWLYVWTLFQSALCLAIIFGVASALENRAWFAQSSRPWLDPWTLEAVGIALAGLNSCWAILRRRARKWRHLESGRRFRIRQVFASHWLVVDRATSGGLVALVALIGSYAAIPGVLQELSPRTMGSGAMSSGNAQRAPARVVPAIASFECSGIPHKHAAGWGSWLLLASVVVLLAVITREAAAHGWLLCLFVAAAVSCPLLASHFEGEVATASALRWLCAGFLLIASVPIWGRGWVARQAPLLGWPPLESGRRLFADAYALALALGLGPPLAMGLGIGIAAMNRLPHSSSFWTDAYALFIVAAMALVVGGSFWTVAWLAGVRDRGGRRLGALTVTSALTLALGTTPVLAVLLYHVGLALKQSPILGPNPDSIFVRIGLAVNYATPVLIVAATLVGYALRERSSGFALSGSLVLCAGATGAYLLGISKGGLRFDAAQWIRLAQINAAIAASYSLIWLALLTSVKPDRAKRESLSSNAALCTQLALAPAVTALVLGWAWCSLVWNPLRSAALTQVMSPELADGWGLASFALVCGSIGMAIWASGIQLEAGLVSAVLVALAIFAADRGSFWDKGNWVSYNTLFVGHGAIALVLLGMAWREARRWQYSQSAESDASIALGGRPRALWVVLQCGVIFLLAARELPDNRWWPAAGFAVLGVVLGPAMAWLFQQQRYLYAAAPLVNAAGVLIWNESLGFGSVSDFTYLNILLLAIPVVPWLVIELQSIRPGLRAAWVNAPPAHRLATRISLAVLAVVVGLGLFADAQAVPLPASSYGLQWIALAAIGVAAFASLWDVEAKDSVAGLYVWGVVAGGMLLDEFDLSPTWLLWMGNVVTASYALATSYLWSRRNGLRMLAARLGVPRGPEAPLAALGWLVPSNVVLIVAVVAMTLVIELTNREFQLRIVAAQATLVQVASLALLARGDRRGVRQAGALLVGAVGAVMFGLAWLEIGSSLTLINCLVVVAAALALVAAIYGFVLGKLLGAASDWLAPAQRLTDWLAALAGISILAVLGVEIYEFSQVGSVQIAWPAIIVVAVTLAALAAAALAAAILPGRDPLGLSERGRTLYVYGAEVILALLFAHIRLTLPWLFSGFFQQYWPLVVMGIAFLGVGFAELCRRRDQRILAEPIENTGSLLPVLPVLGYWASSSKVDYSLLLLCVGVFYTGLSIARRSFGFGILAALAANGGLWYFLNRQEGWEFLVHPQIWLIPPALCVLAAAYLNRSQLNQAQMTMIRYLSSMSIYLSSTGDIFLSGVAQAPMLPLVLAGLSLLGIAAGILLRVRAFLFLGTGFLLLALFTIIWHAAVDLDQTWIWYASGIVMGILILALFAMFEKKRQVILEAFENIKQWEG